MEAAVQAHEAQATHHPQARPARRPPPDAAQLLLRVQAGGGARAGPAEARVARSGPCARTGPHVRCPRGCPQSESLAARRWKALPSQQKLQFRVRSERVRNAYRDQLNAYRSERRRLLAEQSFRKQTVRLALLRERYSKNRKPKPSTEQQSLPVDLDEHSSRHLEDAASTWATAYLDFAHCFLQILAQQFMCLLVLLYSFCSVCCCFY